MYAVIMTNGKQYRVIEGDRVKVQRFLVDVGDRVEFDRVLMLGDGGQSIVGDPLVEGAKVSAVVQSHGRSRKIRVVKFKRRKGYLRQQGHRQEYTEVQIMDISSQNEEAVDGA